MAAEKIEDRQGVLAVDFIVEINVVDSDLAAFFDRSDLWHKGLFKMGDSQPFFGLTLPNPFKAVNTRWADGAERQRSIDSRARGGGCP